MPPPGWRPPQQPQGAPPNAPPPGWQPPRPPYGQQQFPPQYGQPHPPYPPPTPPHKRSGLHPLAIIGIIIGGLFVFLVLIGIIGAIADAGNAGKATATPAQVGAVAATPASTALASPTLTGPTPTGNPSATVKPTAAEKPSATPKPTVTPAPTATPLPSLNQTVSVKNWDVTVTGADKAGKSLTYSSDGQAVKAVGQWIVVTVTMKNTGKENFGVNDPDFTLYDASGNKYSITDDISLDAEYSVYRGGNQVGGQVPPGESVTYYLVFDVGSSATGLQLQFNQDKNPRFNLGL